MSARGLVNAPVTYRRPGTPVYECHFRHLPKEVLQQANASVLGAVLQDESLPARVREHAAGALGEMRDRRALGMLIRALARLLWGRGKAQHGLRRRWE